jgi:hypothetical protein
VSIGYGFLATCPTWPQWLSARFLPVTLPHLMHLSHMCFKARCTCQLFAISSNGRHWSLPAALNCSHPLFTQLLFRVCV